MFKEILSLAILAATQIATAADLPTISAVGSKFFYSNGTQYYIKGRWFYPSTEESLTEWNTGVAYQLTDQDPLVNETQCTLDASLMAELGANTIRVYHVDPEQDHDGCMSAFANVGIYLFVDLDTFDTQFNQASR